eukprot:142879-Amphidinium_carterae.1
MKELLSTIESGQKEPHCSTKDASSRVRERRPVLVIVCLPLLSGLLQLELSQLRASIQQNLTLQLRCQG